jgi:hypothetical protein
VNGAPQKEPQTEALSAGVRGCQPPPPIRRAPLENAALAALFGTRLHWVVTSRTHLPLFVRQAAARRTTDALRWKTLRLAALFGTRLHGW